MRALGWTCLFFLVLCACWVGAGHRAASDAAAPASALHRAMDGSDPVAALRAAHVLACRGDRSGDQYLLAVLRQQGDAGDASLGAMAETLISAVWQQRQAPDTITLRRLDVLEKEPGRTGDWLEALEETLENHPGWCDGYLRRARHNFSEGEHLAARRDLLNVLTLEPDHFDALVLLSQVLVAQRLPHHAYTCLDRAVRVNPRLKSQLRSEIRDVLRALDFDRERRRRERLKDRPLV